jgi:hypothetical protein
MRRSLSEKEWLHRLEYIASMFFGIAPRACRENVVDGVIATTSKRRQMLFLKFVRLAAALYAVIRAVATTVVAALQHFFKLLLRQVNDLRTLLERTPPLSCFAKVLRVCSTVSRPVCSVLFWVFQSIAYMPGQDRFTILLVILGAIKRKLLFVFLISGLPHWFIYLNVLLLTSPAFWSMTIFRSGLFIEVCQQLGKRALRTNLFLWSFHSLTPFITGSSEVSGGGLMRPTGMAIPCHSFSKYTIHIGSIQPIKA